MQFLNWECKYKQLKDKTNLLLLSNLVLVLLLGLSMIVHFNRKPIVVIEPMLNNQELDVRAHTLTKSYAVSFGVSMALLIGNVTSDNMSFILQSISNYVAPQFFAQFRKQLVADMNKLHANKLDMSFTPTKSYFDEEKQQVVVEGVASIIDVSGSRQNNLQAYYFNLDMHDYVPRITNIVSIQYTK